MPTSRNYKDMEWKKLNQAEFIAISEAEVKLLNASEDNEHVCQAWRDGYLYAMQRIWGIYSGEECNGYNTEIMTALEEKLDEINHLDYFNDDLF